jgi:hypothetical protein
MILKWILKFTLCVSLCTRLIWLTIGFIAGYNEETNVLENKTNLTLKTQLVPRCKHIPSLL